MTIALAMLLVRFESICAPVTAAVFVITPSWVTVAVMLRVALAPFISEPMVQTPPASVPIEGVEVISVRPAGSTSLTLTPVASEGPLFVTVRMKWALLPKSGVALSTVLVIARSATTGAGIKTSLPRSVTSFCESSLPLIEAPVCIAMVEKPNIFPSKCEPA